MPTESRMFNLLDHEYFNAYSILCHHTAYLQSRMLQSGNLKFNFT
jgi:hypothetical protein